MSTINTWPTKTPTGHITNIISITTVFINISRQVQVLLRLRLHRRRSRPLPPPGTAYHAAGGPPPVAPLPPSQALLVYRIPARAARHHPLLLCHLLQADGAARPLLELHPRRERSRRGPAGVEEELVESAAEGGAGEGVWEGGGGEEAGEVAGAEGAAAEGGVVGGDAKGADEDEEDVLARGGAVGAGAGRGGGEGDGVDVGGGAEDEEGGGVGAVEEEEAVVEGPDYAVRDGLGRRAEAAAVAVAGVVVGWG
ncbi:hypothetical protein TIFTF001_009217 [Ficus carica]|uniref:Uncharacterized protein n=1 Tax=Ficus carica TaxID=3494 RepID=A0AA88D3F2_FICCA|nr:hypothetical protein TIFTF001_009217 [Ficus carica]